MQFIGTPYSFFIKLPAAGSLLGEYYTTATKVNASAVLQAVSIVRTAAANSIKGGNDLIQDYKVEDKISLASGSISSASLSSSNVILNISNGGKISVKGDKDKAITIIDSSSNKTSNIYPIKTLPVGITVKNSIVTAAKTFTGKKIDLADYPTATKVNVSAVSQAVSIVETAAANSIKGGKGADTVNVGNGKDTIFGGNDNDKLQGDAGNDTLNGGHGNDTLTGGAGNDVITDYSAGQDSIKVSGTIYNISYKGKNIFISEYNGSSHTYSRTFDLFYDNNFLFDDFTIDSVVDVSDTNYSVGKFTIPITTMNLQSILLWQHLQISNDSISHAPLSAFTVESFFVTTFNRNNLTKYNASSIIF